MVTNQSALTCITLRLSPVIVTLFFIFESLPLMKATVRSWNVWCFNFFVFFWSVILSKYINMNKSFSSQVSPLLHAVWCQRCSWYLYHRVLECSLRYLRPNYFEVIVLVGSNKTVSPLWHSRREESVWNTAIDSEFHPKVGGGNSALYRSHRRTKTRSIVKKKKKKETKVNSIL